MARRRRAGELSIELEQQIFTTFERDLSKGYFMVHPLNNSHVLGAVHLINRLPQVALRTLDAIHLSIARDLEVETLATADVFLTTDDKLRRLASRYSTRLTVHIDNPLRWFQEVINHE